MIDKVYVIIDDSLMDSRRVIYGVYTDKDFAEDILKELNNRPGCKGLGLYDLEEHTVFYTNEELKRI